MQGKLFIILFLVWNLVSFGQQTINGYAPEFVGKKVILYTYQDYITMKRVQIGEGIVAKEDSMFHVNYTIKSTIKGIVEIDNYEADLYLTPETEYLVYFPKSKALPGATNAQTSMYFSDLDTLDINYLILQYQQWFDTYILYHERDIAKGGFIACLDTFATYASKAYEHIDNPFFITYVRYDLAEMQQTNGGIGKSQKRLETYLKYIDPFPVYFENDRYMKFLRAFYDKEFREYLPVTEQEILLAISKSSPRLLMKALNRDIFLAKPELRELIMIDKLGKAFYRELDFRPNILTILDSVANYSTVAYNANVALNVKNYITKLEPGYPAPAMNIKLDNREPITWANYQGKFVYLNFFATWNERSVYDMEIISKLILKYDADITFISICNDEDSAAFKDFMAAHPKYNWDIYFLGANNSLASAFNVSSFPAYFLIDQDGFIFSAPALAPSPNGEYQSVDKTLYDIQRALHPKENPRVGER